MPSSRPFRRMGSYRGACKRRTKENQKSWDAIGKFELTRYDNKLSREGKKPYYHGKVTLNNKPNEEVELKLYVVRSSNKKAPIYSGCLVNTRSGAQFDVALWRDRYHKGGLWGKAGKQMRVKMVEYGNFATGSVLAQN